MTLANSEASSSIEGQLISNQIWETVAFVAKAAFMLGLTPWMLQVWGSRGYGEFALASSTFVLLSILDLGIRGRTRVMLCRARAAGTVEVTGFLAQAVVAFSVVSIATIALVAIFDQTHLINRMLGISTGNQHLLLVTTVLAMLVMLSGLLLEPLIAAGHIGRVKFATAIGWLLAIPLVAVVLSKEGSVTTAVLTWLGSLLGANILMIALGGSHSTCIKRSRGAIGLRAVIAVVREGFWFNLANTTWFARTYGATFLISALNGPVTAGVFYILLRLSEVVSALGAISADVSLGELSRASSAEERRQVFRSSYSWAVLLCAHSALTIGFLTRDFYQAWLHPAVAISPWAGLVVAGLGLGSALNRTATYAATGLGASKTAAKWGIVEAIAFTSLLAVVPGSLLERLAVSSLSACALFPVVVAISHRLEQSFMAIWLRPFRSVAPFIAASGCVLLVASLTGNAVLKIVAIVTLGLIGVLNIVCWKSERRSLSELFVTTRASCDLPC